MSKNRIKSRQANKEKGSTDSDNKPSTEIKKKEFDFPKIEIVKKTPHLSQIHPYIYISDRFLSPKSCENIINKFETYVKSNNIHSTEHIKGKGYAVRNNLRISFIDKDFAKELWENSGLREMLRDWSVGTNRSKRPIGLYENIRLYRYSEGQKFGKHYDDHFKTASGNLTEYTLLIYLNAIEKPSKNGAVLLEKTCGGETVFYTTKSRTEGVISVSPEQGKLLLHKHGADCLIHESKEVIYGVKYILRSDVVFG